MLKPLTRSELPCVKRLGNHQENLLGTTLGTQAAFKESVIRVYARQILLGPGLSAQATSIMHRDIKGANILVDTTGLVKVADFGASKQIEDLVTMGEP